MGDATCSVEDCNSPVSAKGLCKKHYKRNHRRQQRERGGDLESLRGTLAETRFWSWVEVGGPGECWPWKGKYLAKGYAKFYISDAFLSVLVHRFAYILAKGPDSGWSPNRPHVPSP